MRCALLIALCCSCAALRSQPMPEAECKYVGEAQYNPRLPLAETDTFGPSSVLGVHRSESYLIVQNHHVFRCTPP